MKFHIANMTCGGCARGITTASKDLFSYETHIKELHISTVHFH